MRAPAAGSYHFDRPESLWFEQLENLSEDELYELARRRAAAPPRLRRGAQTLRTQRHLCHHPAPPPAAKEEDERAEEIRRSREPGYIAFAPKVPSIFDDEAVLAR